MAAALTALSSILGALFVVTGGVKVLKLPASLAIRDHFSLTPKLWTAIGIAESLGGAALLLGLAVRWIGVAAALGLAALMTGAVISRLRVRDPAVMLVLDLGVLALVLAELALLIAA